MPGASLDSLSSRIISCTLCPRLILYRTSVAGSKSRFKNDVYWAKPLPGFGDPNAKIMLVGLAPAAHGGNRTGRIFTGDESSQNLMAALYSIGLASQPYSISRDDGLKFYNIYITSIVKCAPPGNKPKTSEISNCLPYLVEEILLLSKVKVYVALGHVAWLGLTEALYRALSVDIRGFRFKHGLEVSVGSPRGGIWVLASYHPSPRNVRTGRLSVEGLARVFLEG